MILFLTHLDCVIWRKSMTLKHLFQTLLVFGAASVVSLQADESSEQPECSDAHFYLKIGSGASFANRAKIHAPSAEWDPAIQGYNGDLGTRPIINGGLGYEFCRTLAADILFSYRPNFKYKKFQVVIPNSNTPGLTGNKTRRFNLDVSSFMGTLYLSGHGFDPLCWNLGCIPGMIYPIIGGGIGISQMKIFNFRSTGLPSVDPASDPSPSFISDNAYTIRYRFTYQVLAGFEYRYHDRWAISAGYRWFDVRKFKGPRYIRNNVGNAVDVGHNEWRINFSANELFLELKIFL